MTDQLPSSVPEQAVGVDLTQHRSADAGASSTPPPFEASYWSAMPPPYQPAAAGASGAVTWIDDDEDQTIMITLDAAGTITHPVPTTAAPPAAPLAAPLAAPESSGPTYATPTPTISSPAPSIAVPVAGRARYVQRVANALERQGLTISDGSEFAFRARRPVRALPGAVQMLLFLAGIVPWVVYRVALSRQLPIDFVVRLVGTETGHVTLAVEGSPEGNDLLAAALNDL